MEKTLTKLTCLLLSLFTTASLSAQEYIPKNEFTINVFGGANIGMFTASGDYAFDRSFVPSYGIGVGYIHHINESWAIQTGLDFAMYNYRILSSDQDFVDVLSGTGYTYKPVADASYAVDEISVLRLFSHENFDEKSHLGALQVPLMLQYKTPISEKLHFYAAGGATLALNLYGKYEQNVSSASMTDQLIQMVPAMKNPGFTPYIDITETLYGSGKCVKGDLEKNLLDIKASIELGLRWAITPGFGIYTGLFLDYGILPAFVHGDYSIVSDDSDQSQWVPDDGAWNETKKAWWTVHSILNSSQPPEYTTGEGLTVNGSISDSPIINGSIGDPYIDRMTAGMAGLKFRFSFGKAKIAAPVGDPASLSDVKESRKGAKDNGLDEEPEKEDVPEDIQKVMVELSNTLFAFNKFDLNDKAKGYLNEVAEWIKQNEDLRLELAGHTDNIGTEEYNQKLSESRAKEVYKYLVKQGVKKENLTYKGYGKTQPIATNDTEEGRQQNRRVELKILK